MGVTDGSLYKAKGGTCTGHKDKTELPYKMLLPPRCFGNTTMILGGHFAVTPGIHRRPAFRPFPKVPEGPAIVGPCVKVCRAMSTQRNLWGLVQLVLLAGYSGSQMLASAISP